MNLKRRVWSVTSSSFDALLSHTITAANSIVQPLKCHSIIQKDVLYHIAFASMMVDGALSKLVWRIIATILVQNLWKRMKISGWLGRKSDIAKESMERSRFSCVFICAEASPVIESFKQISTQRNQNNTVNSTYMHSNKSAVASKNDNHIGRPRAGHFHIR
jgi:hypothetical protein